MKAIDNVRIDRWEVTADGTSVPNTGLREWQATIGKAPIAVA